MKGQTPSGKGLLHLLLLPEAPLPSENNGICMSPDAQDIAPQGAQGRDAEEERKEGGGKRKVGAKEGGEKEGSSAPGFQGSRQPPTQDRLCLCRFSPVLDPSQGT